MSQLSGLNQPQALTNANNNKEISATSTKPSIANVSVTPGLMATFTISNSGLSIQQQLTMQQAQNLSGQSLQALVQQQVIQIFLTSQITQTSITLPAQLIAMTRQWLSNNLQLEQPNSKALLEFISAHLVANKGQFPHLLSASLQQQKLLLTFMQNEPIVEIKQESSAPKTSNEQFLQLLHFMLPVPADDNAYMLLKQQAKSGDSDESSLQFELKFDLAALGALLIQVELNDFQLTTRCVCQTHSLLQKLELYWPKLQQRLAQFGFEVTNENTVNSKITDEASSASSTSLINIKV